MESFVFGFLLCALLVTWWWYVVDEAKRRSERERARMRVTNRPTALEVRGDVVERPRYGEGVRIVRPARTLGDSWVSEQADVIRDTGTGA